MQTSYRYLAILFIFSFTCFSQAIFAATEQINSLAPMLQNVLPAIVNIKAQIKITDFATLRELQKQQKNHETQESDKMLDTFVSVASGVIVDANKGYILTNAHVINDAQSITITLSDGRHFTAKLIGTDKPSDVALLQIKAKNLIAVPLGDSNKVKVGDFVAAIGNPFGLNQTVTSGIVSAVGRTTLGIEGYENFIQTDASINPGNSGGALINVQGQLVGINTAILAPNRGNIGIGFAIPANMAKSVMNQLIEYGDVKRGILGIGVQDMTPDLANAFNAASTKGAAISQVLPDSPAANAGIQVGDIITNINGSEIKTASDVINTVGFLRVNSKATINLLRGGKTITANVALIDAKKRLQMQAETDPFLYSVGLKDFTLTSPIHGNVQGVLVVSLEQDSNAWNSDLRPGDVIISANKQKISNINELKSIVSKADKTLLLNVLRGQSALFLVVNRDSNN